MKISQILKDKPSQDIHRIDKDATIEEASQMLSRLRIGSLVVGKDGGKIEGILSERDIVRELGVSGVGCLKKQVSELMTADVTTVDPEAENKAAMKIMSEGRFRHLPVVDGDKLVGLISIGDVVQSRIYEMEHENSALTEMISGATY